MSPTDTIIPQTILSVLCTVNPMIDTLTITFLLQTAPVALHDLYTTIYKIGSSFRNHQHKTTNLVLLTLGLNVSPRDVESNSLIIFPIKVPILPVVLALPA